MIDRQVGWYKLLQAKPLVEAMVEDADPDPLSLAVERYGSVRKYAPMFLQAFTFRSARRHDPLLAALDVLKLLSKDGRRALPARFPVGHLAILDLVSSPMAQPTFPRQPKFSTLISSNSPIVPETANLTASALNTASCSSRLSRAKCPKRPRN